jgi:NADPH:quinone reductase-like Zn-dependent oxidoreductase
MKALTLEQLGGLDHLTVRDVPAPSITSPDQVLVRIKSAALNHLDLFVLQGLPGVKYIFPHIMGGDGAGVVEEVGADVKGLKPGDRVMINPGLSCYHCASCLAGEHSLCETYRLLGEHLPGTAAEFLVVPALNLAPVPADMSWQQAAAFSLATLTAWRMLTTRAKLRPGETVLIWGIGGGVSIAALQIARLAGARVYVTSSSDAKLTRAKALGADETINHATQDVAAVVRKLTEKRGVDVVVDNVGEQTWERSLRCLGRAGRLVTCGGTSGPMVTTDVRKLFWYQWNILGSTMGNYQEYQEVVRLAHRGKLWPVVDHVFPMDQAKDAFARLGRGEQMGKLVIEVAP